MRASRLVLECTDQDEYRERRGSRCEWSSSRTVAEKTLDGTHLLVAAGRTPNTEGIGLELAGVEVNDRGFLKVNERLQTTAENVWAIGEVAGSPLFTHISVDDFRVVHANLTGGKRVTTGRQVPFCLFTDPELRSHRS